MWLSGCRAGPDLTQGEPLFAEAAQDQECLHKYQLLIAQKPQPTLPPCPKPSLSAREEASKRPVLPSPMSLPAVPVQAEGKAPGLRPSGEGRENWTGAACRYNQLLVRLSLATVACPTKGKVFVVTELHPEDTAPNGLSWRTEGERRRRLTIAHTQ